MRGENKFHSISYGNNSGGFDPDERFDSTPTDEIYNFIQTSAHVAIIGIQTQILWDKSDFRDVATKKHTITLRGTHTGSGSWLFNKGKALRDSLDNHKEWRIGVKNTSASSEIFYFSNCSIKSIDIAETDLKTKAEYTVVFESTHLANDCIENFSLTYDIQTDNSLSYFSGPSGIPSGSHIPFLGPVLRGTETLTVSSRVLDSGVQAASHYTVDNYDTIWIPRTSGTYYYPGQYVVRKVNTKSIQQDATEGSVTIASDFFLVPTGVKDKSGNTIKYNYDMVGSLNFDVTRSAQSFPHTISLNGTVVGLDWYESGFSDIQDTARHYLDSMWYLAEHYDGLYPYEHVRDVFNPINNKHENLGFSGDRTGTWGSYQPIVDRNASGIGSANSVSITLDNNDNSLDYRYDFDLSSNYRVTNCLYQSVSITEEVGVPTYAIHPVLGKTNGPVISSTYSKNANNRNISMDLKFRKGCNIESEQDSIDTIIVNNTPIGNVIQMTANSKTENDDNNFPTAKINVGWVFNDTYINLSNRFVDHFGNTNDTTSFKVADLSVPDLYSYVVNGVTEGYFHRNTVTYHLSNGYGDYHNDKFTVSSTAGGSGTLNTTSGVCNYYQREALVCRIRANGQRVRDNQYQNIYGVFRIEINPPN